MAQKSIRKRMLVSQITILVVSILSIVLATIFIINKQYTISQKKQLLFMSSSMSVLFKNKMDGISKLLLSSSDDLTLEKYIESDDKKLIERFLLGKKDLVSAIGYFNAEGKLIARVFEGKLLKKIEPSRAKTPKLFIKSKKEPNKIFATDIQYCPDNNQAVVRFSIGITDGVTGEFKGIIFATAKVYDLMNLGRFKNHKNLIVNVIDKTHKIVTSSKKEYILKKLPHSEILDNDMFNKMDHNRKGFSKTPILGIQSFVAYAPVLQNHSVLITSKYAKLEMMIKSLVKVIGLITVFVVLVMIFMVFRVSRNITVPIQKLLNGFSAVAKGDFSKIETISTQDELEDLANAFNEMSQMLVIAQADTELFKNEIVKKNEEVENALKDVSSALTIFSDGDYSYKIEIKYDDYYNKLKILTNSLGETLYEKDLTAVKQNWLKDGLRGLNDSLVETTKIQEVCKISIDYICNYLEAGIGAIYLYDEEKEILTQYASYAFVQREDISSRFKLGEGTVGQVALQKTPINLRNIKLENMVIQTGTTTQVPFNTYTAPLLYQNSLFGVLEIGTFELINEEYEIFFKEADKIIATAVSSSLQQESKEKFLKQSEISNKELSEVNSMMEEQQQQLEEANALMEEQQQQLVISQQELNIQNESLEKSQEEIEQASRYKSEFLANMSHELRTPLNSIILLSELLSKNRNKNLIDKDIEKSITINKSGNELLRLINDILDLSKVESGKMEMVVDKFQSSDLLTEIKDLFEVVANDKGLDFIIEDLYNDYVINDKDRISQIIRNLISNAFKFTNDGSITVKFEHSNDNSMPVSFSVIDTGIGIPQEKQKLIFEAFKQADGSTSREYGGTGLGLSISKELVKMLGGKITLSSNYGEGSKFTVILPNLKDQLSSNKDFIKTPKIEIKKKLKIIDDSNILSENDETFLIIDDDKDFSKTIYEEIKQKNLNCLIALNGNDGLEKVEKYNVQGIILDLELPDIDGVNILKKLKSDSLLQNIPVHIISGRDKDEVLFKIGAIGYTQKPILNNDIEVAIKNLACHGKKKIKDLLIVEKDIKERNDLKKSIGSNVNIKGVSTSQSAINEIKKGNYDTVVVSLGFNDGTCEVCEFIKHNYPTLPIIIYANKDELDNNELEKIQEYAHSIILKTANSKERVLSEINNFLHRVEYDEEKEETQYEEDIDLDGMTILVADDDIKNIFVLDTALSEYGATIVRAKNGKDAIEKIKENEKIDIVLMDIMMPVMDGYEAIQKIREDKAIKNIPVIAVTAKAMKEDRDKCLKAGADDYMSKPIDISKLLQLIKVWTKKQHR